MSVFPLYDDVGSFPLPENSDREQFKKYYWAAYEKLINKDMGAVFKNQDIYNNYITPFLESFKLKQKAGVKVINYPQHIDMYNQFRKPLKEYEKEPGLIDSEKAYISESLILNQFARERYQESGEPLNIKLCITGPIELYMKDHSFTVYKDLALNYSKTVNRFLKNSIFNSKYIQTSTVSIDEPSFGYVDLYNIAKDDLTAIFDKSVENLDCDYCQIHLHTLNEAQTILQSENIDILTCEYASDHSNIISKKMLDEYDKFIRVGITRTNIDNIAAEALDAGTSQEELKTFKGRQQLIDSEEKIEKNLIFALEHYRDRLKFVGPDCGLSSWTPSKLAFELLQRTSKVINKTKNKQ
jgi:5-methyltetrahydropteroyltriglutamate--homocysteine methyltransferase